MCIHISIFVSWCVCLYVPLSTHLSVYVCPSVGIPVYQQQLVYGDTELQDENCLAEHGIPSGAQLKLLIAMRGGPIHAQRGKSGNGAASYYINVLVQICVCAGTGWGSPRFRIWL